MYRIFLERLRQGKRTAAYPREAPTLPPRFRGAPVVAAGKCPPECRACVDACPTEVVKLGANGPALDLGGCLFCGDCQRVCPAEAISFTRDHRLAVRGREDLVVTPGEGRKRAEALGAEMRRLFGRSLKLRQVSAGGCGACEADLNVLSTLVYDLGRFGIQFVASPRHADGVVVTGPVSENMRLALRKTYDAVPAPKLVIAVGACAISGGPYAGHPEVHDGVGGELPVDLYVPGCPPHPYTILDGLLRLLGRLPRERVEAAAR
jgi:Ni,Fe-hydrogenase III small subunit/NAD-dependent dihydropyrimidine dehydrogenase PreA subunit